VIPAPPAPYLHPLRHLLRAGVPFLALAMAPPWVEAQIPPFEGPTPVRQSELSAETGGPPLPFTTRTAARPTRWLGQEVRDVRWAPDGSATFFRWHHDPAPGEDPELDPWYRVDRDGTRVSMVEDGEVHRIPGSDLTWSEDGERAAWSRDGGIYVWDGSLPTAEAIRPVFSGARPGWGGREVRILRDGSAVEFLLGQDLVRYDLAQGRLEQVTRRHERVASRLRRVEAVLEEEQRRLFRQHRVDEAWEQGREARARALDPLAPQPIPVEPDFTLSSIRLSPDGRWVTFRGTRVPGEREPVRYADYATRTGITEIHDARPKIGEPRDEVRLGVVRVDPAVHPDSVEVRWIEPTEAVGRETVIHGPWWSLEGDRAVIQTMSRDHKDLWISELDLETGETRVLSHEHDPAWLGGPPPLAGSLQPALLEWLPGGRFVFASERTGWSHLYLAELDGTIRALTEGPWEVRGATLTRDRARWLVTGSREHPADDHLYFLPADGGELVRLTERVGRNTPFPSPDGLRLAVLRSDNVTLPDLFLRDTDPQLREGVSGGEVRVTVSGTDRYHRYPLVRPEIVSFPHPDGDPVWAALFVPPEPNPERAAVLHIHGGGYRQFAHRGWSVYGYHGHLGFIHHLLQQGYTVLDFDYRGSAGFGRDYRTDIYRAMGQKDVDGAVAGADYLVREHGIDPGRIGMYGISYGGFFTLMSLFRYPGVFAAGVSDDGVTDWFHYSDGWTSRILGLPQDDPEPFRLSSPIYHAEGLQDPLLISHGVIDDNVHFQDAVRLVQRLIELEKDFEVMYYPIERHNFRTESSRYDYYRRVDRHFQRHLLGRDTPGEDTGERGRGEGG
jgi:dipeptidyl aminopeptidase/acylaminoacyl peptidase